LDKATRRDQKFNFWPLEINHKIKILQNSDQFHPKWFLDASKLAGDFLKAGKDQILQSWLMEEALCAQKKNPEASV